jgi:hypothetical protein
MLAAGAPLTEIEQVLRHRRRLYIASCAKVDMHRLGTWPGGAA